MKNSTIALILHFSFLLFLYAPGSNAETKKASELSGIAFKAGAIDNNFKLAKDAFGRLAALKEKELQNVEVAIAVKNHLLVGTYRVLEQVADDALKKKITEKVAKALTLAVMGANMKRPQDAIKLAKKTMTLKGLQNYPNAHFLLGRFYLNNCVAHGKNCEEGFKEHQIALKYNPNLIHSYMDMGSVYMKKKQYKDAKYVIEKASSLPSQDGMQGVIHVRLVVIYGEENKWKEANKHLKKAESLGIIFPKELVALVKQRASNGVSKTATKSAASEKKSTLAEDSPLIKIFKIGIVHGNFKVVADEFNLMVKEEENKLQKGDPFTAPGHSAHIGFYRVLAKVAEDVLNKKIPEKVGKELLVSGMANKSGRIKEAININKGTLKKIKNYPGANFLLGRSYFVNCVSKGTHCKESIQQHRTALAHDPDFIHSYLELGIIYLHKKQFKEAIAAYEKAASIPSSNGLKGVSHTALASIYSEIKQLPKSKRHMEKAVSLGVIFPKKHSTTIKQNLAGNDKETKIKIKAFNAGHNGNFKVAKNLLNAIAVEAEEKLKTVHVLEGMSNTAPIGHYRVLEQVANDALEKKIATKAAKLLFEVTKLAGVQLNDAIRLTSNTILSENLQSYSSAHFLLGRFYLLTCFQKGENCAESLKEHQTALKYDPKLIYSYLDMGAIYKKMKKSDETIKVYEKASSVPSNNRIKGLIHFELTKEYGQLMQGTKAKEHLQKSISLGIEIPKVITEGVDITILMEQKSADSTKKKWVLVAGGKAAAKSVYFDPNTLRKSGDMIVMPVIIDYKSAKLGKTGERYKSVKSEFELDCNKKQFRAINFAAFSEAKAKGKRLESGSKERKWEKSQPGIVGTAFLEHACTKTQISMIN